MQTNQTKFARKKLWKNRTEKAKKQKSNLWHEENELLILFNADYPIEVKMMNESKPHETQ